MLKPKRMNSLLTGGIAISLICGWSSCGIFITEQTCCPPCSVTCGSFTCPAVHCGSAGSDWIGFLWTIGLIGCIALLGYIYRNWGQGAEATADDEQVSSVNPDLIAWRPMRLDGSLPISIVAGQVFVFRNLPDAAMAKDMLLKNGQGSLGRAGGVGQAAGSWGWWSCGFSIGLQLVNALRAPAAADARPSNHQRRGENEIQGIPRCCNKFTTSELGRLAYVKTSNGETCRHSHS